jgi:DNA adenine methylase
VTDLDAIEPLTAPFPWFGGKSLAAPIIWQAFGNVPNYVEPFAGSLATLLARPHTPKVETVNDKDALIANFFRAVQTDPHQVAHFADWPVNEADLHARHLWLVQQLPMLDRLIVDPNYCDAKIAGWWVWGLCAWIGNGWCSKDERLKQNHCLPKIGTPGHGIHSVSRKKPLTHRNKGVHRDSTAGELVDLFERLAARLRHVRVCCGDWTRVLGNSTLGIDTQHGMTPCGVLLDPPYAHGERDKRLYRNDDANLSDDVRAWALEHGDNPHLRIALCGWEGEHDMPASWRKVAWKSKGSTKNRLRERLWFSPHCQDAIQGTLFS